MKKAESGMTLAELLIACAMIGIGIIVAAGASTAIHRAIQTGKARTIATNIAQEKMQIVMQKSYYEVLVTTLPATRTDVSPNITYDPNYFSPETLTEGGVSFTRYTLVQVVQEVNGVIQVVDPMTPDTGIRQITVSVVWATDRGNMSLTIQNVLNNPNTPMASTWLRGTVTDAASGVAISSALVDAAEDTGWRDTTNNAGNYGINLVPGTYDFMANADGYYPSIINKSVAFNGSTPLNFSLTAIASGTLQGSAWIDNHLVISQVVAATSTVPGGGGGNQDVEYIELYNPTTSPINIGAIGTTTPNIVPVLWDNNNNGYMHRLVYVSTYVPVNGFYLISNTGVPPSPASACYPFTVTGVPVTPDACWEYVLAPNHAFECGSQSSGCSGPSSPDAGGISIANSSAYTSIPGSVNMSNWPTARIDSVAWSNTSAGHPCPSNAAEGSCISSSEGLWIGEQYARTSTPGGTPGTGVGRAYDANNNSTDFYDSNPMTTYRPYTTAYTYAPLSGTPATGAHVSVTDGLSATSTTTLTGSPPYAQFTVPGVATGTWTVFIDSNSSSAEIDTVTVVSNTTTSIPNASTTPSWPAANVYASILSTTGVVGIINGKVTDDTGVPIAGGIKVTAGANSVTSAVNGNYSLRITPGTYDIVANPGNLNSAYETQTYPGIMINLGDVTADENFELAKGGKISGWITRDGINPLPGVTVTAFDQFGDAHDTEASGNNGNFTLINLTTGPYTVQPSLDSSEASTPASGAVTVTAGTNVWVGTFTVSGAMGQVQGTVTSGGSPINTGVLIVISTGAIAMPLPALSSNTLTSTAFYADSSNESGTYSVDVRGSTTSVYNVEAFYMHLNNQTPVISTATCTNVTVNAGLPTTQSTKSCLAFSW